MSNFDEIHEAPNAADEPDGLDGLGVDVVIIRGIGNTTVFGLNNRFSCEFPPMLAAKVAPEEYRATIQRINSVLKKNMPLSMRWLLCGCVCCCCTAGCSLWPVICFNKRMRHSLEKALEWENTNLYQKLNLRWRLARHRCDNSSLLEYVLLVDFLPKQHLNRPD